MSLVNYEQDEHVTVITLNRPERLNAMSPEMKTEFLDAMRKFEEDENARVAILTGAGRSFCAGRDLKSQAEGYAQGDGKMIPLNYNSEYNLFGMPDTNKPIVAAVNGFAMGLGWYMVLDCDIRVAAAGAQFAMSEVPTGALGPYWLAGTDIMPWPVAAEIALIGDRLPGRAAALAQPAQRRGPGRGADGRGDALGEEDRRPAAPARPADQEAHAPDALHAGPGDGPQGDRGPPVPRPPGGQQGGGAGLDRAAARPTTRAGNAGAAAGGHPRPRLHLGHLRAAVHPDPGRLRRRGHQGRVAPSPRRHAQPDPAARHRPGVVGGGRPVEQPQPQQAQHHPQHAPPQGPRPGPGPGRPLRRRGGELHPARAGVVGAVVGGHARGQPAAGLPEHDAGSAGAARTRATSSSGRSCRRSAACTA